MGINLSDSAKYAWQDIDTKSSIMLGVPGRNKKLSILMIVSNIGFRQYEVVVKNDKNKILLKDTFNSKKGLKDKLARIVIK